MDRKHGHWKIYGYSATCSECGFCEEDIRDNFCTNCGAIMDEEPTLDVPDFSHLPRCVVKKCKCCGFERIVAENSTAFNFCPECGEPINGKGRAQEKIGNESSNSN